MANDLVQIRYLLPHVSQTALATLCKWANDHGGLPDIRDRKEVRVSRDAVIGVNTPYGPIHVVHEVQGFELELQNPWAGLYHLISTSAGLSWAFARCLERHPGVWSLIVYSDEVTPGNQLAHKHARKVQSLYYSFFELGQFLGNEAFWFTGGLVSSADVRNVEGRWSAILKTFIRQFWSPSTGLDMESAGISIPLHASAGGHRIRLRVRFGAALADELALNLFYDSKGASGLKCCMICQNCFDAKTTRPSVRTSDFAALHTCSDFSKFRPRTEGSINAIVDRLSEAHGTMSKAAFKEVSTQLGFNYNPNGILFDPYLLPKVLPGAHCLFDWMHVFFEKGVVNYHIGQFLYAVRKTNFTCDRVRDYVAMWHWPHNTKMDHVAEIFDGSRGKGILENRLLKCTSSEGRSVLPVFAHFVKAALMDNAEADRKWRLHAEGIIHLAAALQELEAAARGTCNGRRLQHHLEKNLEIYKRL